MSTQHSTILSTAADQFTEPSVNIAEVQALVKDDMARLDEALIGYLDSNVPFILEVGDYILQSGGKRYRPMMLFLCARLVRYRGESHIPMAAVMEFIHTATLLHDDVVDNATLRRGNQSVNTKWGTGASILVGDYLLAKSFTLAVEAKDSRLLEVLSSTTTRMAEGEVLQLLNHCNPEKSEEEYLEVITNKTAILLGASCQIAALIGTCSPEEEEALATFGLELGIAYQLTDDCLDYTSSDEDLGKAIGNDLREGKVTLPLIKAYKDATDVEKTKIREVVEADALDENDLKEVFSIIARYDGIDYTLKRAANHVENAKRSLDIFEDSIEHAALVAAADNVLDRDF